MAAKQPGSITKESSEKDVKQVEQKGRACNVQVVVRCRPLSELETKQNTPIVASCIGASEVHFSSSLKGKHARKTYTFDRVFGQYSTQDEVYLHAVAPLVKEVLSGFNCTVFAYGQTGTGKTHTMEGKLDDQNHKEAGVIPRAVRTIFDELGKQSNEYSVKASFLELYNEELSDLLASEATEDRKVVPTGSDDGENTRLRIYEDSKQGTVVNGLEEVLVNNAEEVFGLLRTAQQRRKTAETLLNKNSSRSHCVFSITIHTKESRSAGEDIIKTGKLHLVDLAGSECIGRSGAEALRAKEAGNINKSLLTLGRVITGLVEKARYIPYRDSKLTRLLQESLGGRAKTVIIATISPSSICMEETMSTLDYAHRAKNIKNRPQLNKELTRKAFIKELEGEVAQYKREIEVLRTRNGIFLPPETWESYQAELKSKTTQLEELQFAFQSRKKEFDAMEKMFATKEKEAEELNALAKQLEGKLSSMGEELQGLKKELDNAMQQLEEQKFIVKQHQKTEEKLHEQALATKETLKSALDYVYGLHQNIERRTVCDHLNQQASSRMYQEFTRQMASLQTRFDEFCSRQMHAIANLQEHVQTFTQQKNEEISRLCNQMETMSSQLSGSEEAITAVSEVHILATREYYNRAQNDIETQHSRLKNEISEIQSSCEKADLNLKVEFETQKTELLQWHQTSKTAIERSKTTVQQFAQLHEAQLRQLQSQIDSGAQEQRSMIENQQEFVRQFTAQNEQMVNERIGSIMSKVQEMLTDFKETQVKNVSHASNQLLTKLTDSAQHASSQQSRLTSSSTLLSQGLQQFEKERLAELDSEEKAQFHHIQVATERGQSLVKQTEADNKVLFNSLGQTLSVNKERVEEFKAILVSEDKKLDVFSTSHREALNTLQKDRVSFIRSQNQVINQFNNGINNTLENWNSALKSKNQFIIDGAAQHKTEASTTKSIVDRFMNTDYKPYQKTGTTPPKKEFRYKKQFKKTDSHDKLLSKFRSQNRSGSDQVTPLVAEVEDELEEVFTPLGSLTAEILAHGDEMEEKDAHSPDPEKKRIETPVEQSQERGQEQEQEDQEPQQQQPQPQLEQSQLPHLELPSTLHAISGIPQRKFAKKASEVPVAPKSRLVPSGLKRKGFSAVKQENIPPNKPLSDITSQGKKAKNLSLT